TNEAEFFAVATEYFFDRPQDMERHEGILYAVLRDFYLQDPAERERVRAS
ncbi:MAG: zinc-dependent peptidase, partial [Myxococcota bacterium]